MRTAILTLAAFAAVLVSSSASANAQSWRQILVTYEVQVQYWFFDIEGAYVWNTVFESTNANQAQLMYDLLLLAKENGQLNEVVPASYWRYIAVDVRMKSRLEWRYQPEYFYATQPTIPFFR